MPTGTEAFQSQIDSINNNIAKTNAAFAAFMKKVSDEIRAQGFTVRSRIDFGGDQVFSTTATAQVDVTKNGITARSAYTAFHMSKTPKTAARLATNAWTIKKESANLGIAPSIDPIERDPILHQTAFNFNPEVPFASTKFGAPAVSLPPTNQPGKTNTTVPTGSEPVKSIGKSPNDPANGSQPPISTDTTDSSGTLGVGDATNTTDSSGTLGVVNASGSAGFLDRIGMTRVQAIIAALVIGLLVYLMAKG